MIKNIDFYLVAIFILMFPLGITVGLISSYLEKKFVITILPKLIEESSKTDSLQDDIKKCFKKLNKKFQAYTNDKPATYTFLTKSIVKDFLPLKINNNAINFLRYQKYYRSIKLLLKASSLIICIPVILIGIFLLYNFYFAVN